MLHHILRWALIVLASSASINAYAADEAGKPKIATNLRIEGAYVNVPVPGVKTTAAFFTVRNLSDQPTILVAIETEVAKRAEFHSHKNNNGVMQMRQEKQIVVPAKSTLAFAPGSYHVMLFDLQRSIQTGEELQLMLTLKDGSRFAAAAKVKSIFDNPHHH